MNPLLAKLQPYPFERLRQLFATVTPSPQHRAISLGIGEPKHATPLFIQEALHEHFKGLAAYPATGGEAWFKEACASQCGSCIADIARQRLARGLVFYDTDAD
jgi:N-succinyldiaminopimelate aminotransferase